MKIKDPKTLKRFDIAQVVLAAQNHYDQRHALNHWDVFVPYGLSHMRADEGEAAYVETQYQTLRQYAYEWIVEQRFLELEARVEALEKPDMLYYGGGALG